MIIVCNSCSAQYSVSDAKVRGKLVRITCKHCSTAIVVDGRQMSEVEVPSQKPLAAYVLPRRDESVIAHMPQSIAPARAKAAVSSPAHAAVSAPMHAPVSSPLSAPIHSSISEEMREEDRTMIARSRFGDDMSVHEERTVIGQIPREALEFERMFAQRTQPPPPDAPDAPPTAPPPPVPAMGSPGVPSFSSAPPPENPENSAITGRPPANADAVADDDDKTGEVQQEGPSTSEPPTVGDKPTSDSRGLVSLAEATHPSVVRSASARRLRVTLVTLVVLAVLVALFVIQKPH
ncbi:MAG TPA: zinc-ribbon domain-containing protein [Polyangiaceae bacterium]|nr:zinc-ribbon domain-containing protein [Polyangiaceae bacterium]